MTKIVLKRKGECEFVGAYLPLQLAQGLRLSSLYSKSTITQMIEDALELDFKRTGIPKKAINYIGSQFFRDWQLLLPQNEALDGWKTVTQIKNQFEGHIQKATKLLKSKGINEANIDKIIAITREDYEKDSKKTKRANKKARK